MEGVLDVLGVQIKEGVLEEEEEEEEVIRLWNNERAEVI